MVSHARARAAAPFLALAAASLVLGADPRLPWAAVVVCSAAFASAGVIRAVEASAGVRSVRRATQRRTRDQLSGEIERILAASSPARLPSSSPLNRIAVRRSADDLRRLAARLADDDAISSEAVAGAAHLLRDPSSPLYSAHAGEGLLPAAIARILLEARR
jgi:hypothetical protein